MIAFWGQKKVGPRPDWSPLGVKFKFPTTIPTHFICGVLPPPPPPPRQWFPPFHLGSFRKYGLWFEAMQFLRSFNLCTVNLFMHKISTQQVVCVNCKHPISHQSNPLRTHSLRKHPFLLAVRRWGRFTRNVPGGEERGETDVFAGY